MELNESLIIGVLIVIIIILIFSKITVDYGETSQETQLKQKLDALEMKIKKKVDEDKSQEKSNSGVNNLQSSDMLSDDFKEQLEELENRFYYDNCRHKR